MRRRLRMECQDIQRCRNAYILSEQQRLQREQLMRSLWAQYQQQFPANLRDIQQYNIMQLFRCQQEVAHQNQFFLNVVPPIVPIPSMHPIPPPISQILPLYNNPQPNFIQFDFSPASQPSNGEDSTYLMQFLSCKIINYFTRLSQTLPPGRKMHLHRFLQKRNKDSVFDLLKACGYRCLLTEDVIESPDAEHKKVVEQKVRNDIAMDLVGNSEFLDNVISACDYHVAKRNKPRMSYTLNFR